MPEQPLRIAAVSYLNTAPLIEGLQACVDLRVAREVPSRIGAMVLAGEADVGLASVIDAARGGGGLVALPRAGMIGCRGPTLTVRLMSRVAPERITTLHADEDSHTSTALARVVLDRRWGVRPRVEPFDARAGAPWPESVLLIGDKVVGPGVPAYEHQVDLGQAWHELTGLPFVYAVWVCASARAESPEIRLLEDLLNRQRRRNAARVDWVVSSAAPAQGWEGGLARRYVGSLLRYEVGEDERRAADLFCGWAADLGLCEGRSVAWAERACAVPA